jgi:4'-phosphopantetheinyl transferase
MLTDRARRHFSISRRALRHLVGEYLQIPAEDIQFEHASRGKPSLGQRHRSQQLGFNVSHSGEWALLAFRSGGAIGVDLECIRSSVQWLPLAARYLGLPTPDLDRLGDMPESEGRREFFRLWTRREALLKGIGCGIWASGSDNCMLAEDNWQVAELSLWNGYVGAVAAEGGFLNLEQWDLAACDLAVIGIHS